MATATSENPYAEGQATRSSSGRKVDAVYAQMREDIERGQLKPGQRLSESWLVERTGASRTPVREALRRLAADELIILEPRQPPMVAPLSLQRVRELFAFRRVVEVAAIESISVRAQSATQIQQDFNRLAQEFAALDEGLDPPEFLGQFRRLASCFDGLVVDYAANAYLQRSITGLRPHTSRLRFIAHADHARLLLSKREHIDMCEAVAAGDPHQAGAASRQHLFHVEKSILNSLLSSSRPEAQGIDLRA